MCAAGGLAQWLSYCFLPSLAEAEDSLLGHGIYKVLLDFSQTET